MTDAQTEARAIAQAREIILKAPVNDWDRIIELIAAALAAKDAELAAVKAERDAIVTAAVNRGLTLEVELAKMKISNNKWLAKWERAEAKLAKTRQTLDSVIEACNHAEAQAMGLAVDLKTIEDALAEAETKAERLEERVHYAEGTAQANIDRANEAEARLAEALKAQNYLKDAVLCGLSDQEIARRARLLVRALTGDE